MEKASSRMDATIRRIEEAGLIAILRGDFGVDAVLRIAEALVRSRISILEITLNSREAPAAIKRLRTEFGSSDLLVGAGTVRTAAMQEVAMDAGALFTVAPNLDREVVAAALRLDMVHLPGVLTPSEAEQAWQAGSRLVKLFPADHLGPAYLKAVRAPLDDIGFVPTGGIGAANLGDYVRAGARAVGIGSSLISGPGQRLEDIGQRAAALVESWERAHGG